MPWSKGDIGTAAVNCTIGSDTIHSRTHKKAQNNGLCHPRSVGFTGPNNLWTTDTVRDRKTKRSKQNKKKNKNKAKKAKRLSVKTGHSVKNEVRAWKRHGVASVALLWHCQGYFWAWNCPQTWALRWHGRRIVSDSYIGVYSSAVYVSRTGCCLFCSWPLPILFQFILDRFYRLLSFDASDLVRSAVYSFFILFPSLYLFLFCVHRDFLVSFIFLLLSIWLKEYIFSMSTPLPPLFLFSVSFSHLSTSLFYQLSHPSLPLSLSPRLSISPSFYLSIFLSHMLGVWRHSINSSAE